LRTRADLSLVVNRGPLDGGQQAAANDEPIGADRRAEQRPSRLQLPAAVRAGLGVPI